jgi:hypothetical protein
MRQGIQWTLWVVGLGLQFMVLSALLAGPLRDFLAVFVYSSVLFLTTVIEIFASSDQRSNNELWQHVFWACDFARLAGLYGVVISLISRSVQEPAKRDSVRRLLVTLSIVLWAGSFYIHSEKSLGFVMMSVSRNLSFCLALVNLALWFTLIAGSRRDSTLLMVTGGLGIQMTGEAIAQSLRQMSRLTFFIGDSAAILSHFLCLFIWWQAFSKEGKLLKQTASARTVAKAGVSESRIK